MVTSVNYITPDFTADEAREALGVAYGNTYAGHNEKKIERLRGSAIVTTSNYTVDIKSMLYAYQKDSTADDYVPAMAEISDSCCDLNAATVVADYGRYQVVLTAQGLGAAGALGNIGVTYDASAMTWTITIDGVEYASEANIYIEERIRINKTVSGVNYPYDIYTPSGD